MNEARTQKLVGRYWGGREDIADDVSILYETYCGKSSVYWNKLYEANSEDCDTHDTLPRPDDYETFGFTNEFEAWGAENCRRAIESGCTTYGGVVGWFKGRFAARPVYVCRRESERNAIDRYETVLVASSLEAAQRRMRDELDKYLASCKGEEPTICWHRGDGGVWGWYDENEPEGFDITEMTIDQYVRKEA